MAASQVYQDWTESIGATLRDRKYDVLGFMDPNVWIMVRMSFTLPRHNGVYKLRRIQASMASSSSKRAPIFLRIARGWDCWDPRDKVFALLGVLQMDIPVDYAMSVAEVYTRWAMSPYFDISRGSLLIFSGIGLYPRAEGHSLPSWLPDLHNLGTQILETDGAIVFGNTANEPPERYQPSVGLDGTFRCFGFQVSEVSEVVIPTTKGPDGRVIVVWGRGGRGHDQVDQDNMGIEDVLLRALRYFISNRHQLWGASHRTDAEASRLWALVQAMTKFSPKSLIVPTFDDLHDELSPGSLSVPTLDDLHDELSLENIFKVLRYRHDRKGDAMFEFTPHELDIMGFRSRREVLDCLSDVPEDRGYHTWSVDAIPKGDLIGSVYIGVGNSLVQRSLFHTADGLIGMGPAGVEADDLVYLVHGSSLPVLLRVVGGKMVNVGACYIQGMSEDDAVRIMGERKCDVQELLIE